MMFRSQFPAFFNFSLSTASVVRWWIDDDDEDQSSPLINYPWKTDRFLLCQTLRFLLLVCNHNQWKKWLGLERTKPFFSIQQQRLAFELNRSSFLVISDCNCGGHIRNACFERFHHRPQHLNVCFLLISWQTLLSQQEVLDCNKQMQSKGQAVKAPYMRSSLTRFVSPRKWSRVWMNVEWRYDNVQILTERVYSWNDAWCMRWD